MFILLPFLSCGDSDKSGDECPVITEGEGRIVVGFWDNDDCSGDPLTTNSFPVDTFGYCW